jgi:hypothetical protein
MFSDPFGGEFGLAVAKDKANEIKKSMPCPVHKRKILFQCDYDDSGLNAYITRYCCLEHAKRVAKAFKEAELFDHIYIEKQN